MMCQLSTIFYVSFLGPLNQIQYSYEALRVSSDDLLFFFATQCWNYFNKKFTFVGRFSKIICELNTWSKAIQYLPKNCRDFKSAVEKWKNVEKNTEIFQFRIIKNGQIDFSQSRAHHERNAALPGRQLRGGSWRRWWKKFLPQNTQHRDFSHRAKRRVQKQREYSPTACIFWAELIFFAASEAVAERRRQKRQRRGRVQGAASDGTPSQAREQVGFL